MIEKVIFRYKQIDLFLYFKENAGIITGDWLNACLALMKTIPSLEEQQDYISACKMR